MCDTSCPWRKQLDNGIAQGYIADCVVKLLSAEGLSNILTDKSEIRSFGTHPNGHAWPVKLVAGGEVALVSRALATSASLGTIFDQIATIGHILDPRTVEPPQNVLRAITVSAKSAVLADAWLHIFSTAVWQISVTPKQGGITAAQSRSANLHQCDIINRWPNNVCRLVLENSWLML